MMIDFRYVYAVLCLTLLGYGPDLLACSKEKQEQPIEVSTTLEGKRAEGKMEQVSYSGQAAEDYVQPLMMPKIQTFSEPVGKPFLVPQITAPTLSVPSDEFVIAPSAPPAPLYYWPILEQYIPYPKEPMLLLDITSSNSFPVSVANVMASISSRLHFLPRHELMRQVLRALVADVKSFDSAGKTEEAGGGLRTITFAERSPRDEDGDKAEDIDDLSPENFDERWQKIRWYGSTVIKPGLTKLFDAFDQEFGQRREKPLPVILVFTDGNAKDLDAFLFALEKRDYASVVVALLGDSSFASWNRSPDPKFEDDWQRWQADGVDHQKAQAKFAMLARRNPRISFLDFSGIDDANYVYQNVRNVLLTLLKK